MLLFVTAGQAAVDVKGHGSGGTPKGLDPVIPRIFPYDRNWWFYRCLVCLPFPILPDTVINRTTSGQADSTEEEPITGGILLSRRRINLVARGRIPIGALTKIDC
jgi:hypothetical protein